MQVQRIQNVNYNTFFGAKVKLDGAVRDLPKEVKATIWSKAKKIGTNNDVIKLNIGNKYSADNSSWCSAFYRDIDIVSNINGVEKKHSLTVDQSFKKEININNIRNSILNHLSKIA